jgi:hypothetical protein
VALRSEEFKGAIVSEERVFLFVKDLGRPKVRDFSVVISVDQNILGLQVKVHHFVLVQVLKRRQQLACVARDCLFG